jgi:hypothetical protein
MDVLIGVVAGAWPALAAGLFVAVLEAAFHAITTEK